MNGSKKIILCKSEQSKNVKWNSCGRILYLLQFLNGEDCVENVSSYNEPITGDDRNEEIWKWAVGKFFVHQRACHKLFAIEKMLRIWCRKVIILKLHSKALWREIYLRKFLGWWKNFILSTALGPKLISTKCSGRLPKTLYLYFIYTLYFKYQGSHKKGDIE